MGVLGSAARTVTGEVVDLGTGMDEVKGSVLGPGSDLVVVGEENWGVAGGGVAALGQAWGAVDDEGGGLGVAGPGPSGGDAARRMRSAMVVRQTKSKKTGLGSAAVEETNRQCKVQE